MNESVDNFPTYLQLEKFFKFKIILIGDSNIGKSTLLHRLITGKFRERIIKTVGVEFHTKGFHNIENLQIILHIWDFSGEDRFLNLLPTWLKDVKGCIFMYDISKYTSFISLKKWRKRIFKSISPNIPKFLIGNKLDLREISKNSVSNEEAQSFAEKNKFKHFFECSAITGENIEKPFRKMAEILYNINKIDLNQVA